MHEGAAILGEAPVYQDGSWRAEIPPYLPVHLQPIDRFDLSIRNQLLWIQGMPGESRVCGGCHEDRTSEINIAAPVLAQQKPAAKLVKPIADRLELPWSGAVAGSTQVQDVFDRRCVSCHSGGANDPFAGQTYTVTATLEDGTTESYQIPVLDLSSRPINARYERETVTYPASYVSLLYPSAMMGDARIEGTPTEWVVPGNARASRLIAKMNVDAVALQSDATLAPPSKPEWAFNGKAHPEDVGAPMSREDRVTLIRAIDLGGQYYTRRNIDGGQFTGTKYEP